MTKSTNVVGSIENHIDELTNFRSELKKRIPDFSDTTAWVLRAYHILSKQHLFPNYADVISELLDTACQRFKCDSGFVLKELSDDVLEVISHSKELSTYFVGQHIPIQNFQVIRAQQKDKVLCIADAASTVNLAKLSYTSSEPRAYLGCSINLSGQEQAYLCLFSHQPFSEEVGEQGLFILELLAEGIAGMTESQKMRVQRKSDDFAFKSLASGIQ